MKVLAELLPSIAPFLLSAIVAGTAWVAAHLGAWLKAKAQNSRWAAAAAPLDDLVFSVVQDIENNERQAILGKLSASGGLTAADGVQLKKIAMDRIKGVLGPEGLSVLKNVVGALFGGNLDAWLSGKVETAVAKVSANSAALAAVKASPR